MLTNFKFVVYRYNKRTRPLRTAQYIYEAESFMDALNKFLMRSPIVRELNKQKVNTLVDYNYYSAISVSRITCKVDVYVETVHVALTENYLEYDKFQSFDI